MASSPLLVVFLFHFNKSGTTSYMSWSLSPSLLLSLWVCWQNQIKLLVVGLFQQLSHLTLLIVYLPNKKKYIILILIHYFIYVHYFYFYLFFIGFLLGIGTDLFVVFTACIVCIDCEKNTLKLLVFGGKEPLFKLSA